MSASIQSQVWKGYAQAAAVLGAPYDQYRPSGPSNPTAAANWYGQISAAFDDNSNYQFRKPNLYGHPEKFALVDGTNIQPGDYLIGQQGTLFIAEMPPLMPIVAMQCNVTVDVTRAASNAGVGAQPYGGDVITDEIAVMTGWPAWLMQGYRGEKGDTQLPGDTRMPWYSVLFPAWPGTMIHAADVLSDNNGNRYTISSTELTNFGWRLAVALAST